MLLIPNPNIQGKLFGARQHKGRNRVSLEEGSYLKQAHKPLHGEGLSPFGIICQLSGTLVPEEGWDESQGMPQEHSGKAVCWWFTAQRQAGSQAGPDSLLSKALPFCVTGQKQT